MNEQILKDVLEDVLGELKEANRCLTDMRTRLATLEGEVNGFEQKLNDQQVIVHPPDLAPVLEMTREQGNILREEMAEATGNMRKEMTYSIRTLTDVVESQPKPIVRQWRISLFPERDHAGSWKHFINWLFGAILLALLVGAVYALGGRYIERMYPPQTDLPAVPSEPAGKGEPLPAGKKGEMRIKRARNAKRILPDSSKMRQK